MPREVTLYSIACFASLGLPALAGFVAEFLVFTGSFATLPVPTILCVFGVVLTAGYLLWMLRRAFYGPLNLNWRWLTDVNSIPEFLPLATLAVVIFFVGVYPKLLVDVISPSVTQMIGTIQSLTLR
jgi:NADH-quinone oxidoreductase subunit M